MEDWLEIIKEGEQQRNTNNYDNDDIKYIELPEPEIIDLNDNGTLQKEITYEYDKDDPNKIYRIEKIYYIREHKQKFSESALNRKRNWVKFGQVSNVPKGVIERGVTSQRPTQVQFLWTNNDGITQQPQNNHNQPIKPKKPPKIEEKKNDDDTKSVHSSWSLSNKSSNGGYKLDRSKLEKYYGEPIPIKISNLPQWTSWEDMKYLIDQFYRNHLKVRYIPKYKIKMIPSKWTLQRWEEEGNKERLQEYERMAIVEFENEKNAELAIKVLNGHRYEYCVLCVEKAQQKNNNNYNNYSRLR